MKSKTITNLYCYAYGHNYHRLEKAGPNTPELICKNCKKQFMYNEHGEIVDFETKKNKRTTIPNNFKHLYIR